MNTLTQEKDFIRYATWMIDTVCQKLNIKTLTKKQLETAYTQCRWLNDPLHFSLYSNILYSQLIKRELNNRFKKAIREKYGLDDFIEVQSNGQTISNRNGEAAIEMIKGHITRSSKAVSEEIKRKKNMKFVLL